MRLNSYWYSILLFFLLTLASTSNAAAQCVLAAVPKCEAKCPGEHLCRRTSVGEWQYVRVFGIPILPEWKHFTFTCFCRSKGFFEDLASGDTNVRPPPDSITLDEYLTELLAAADAANLEEFTNTGIK